MKKFLALFSIAALLLTAVAFPVSAGTPSESELFTQDFESLGTNLDTAGIASALGWTAWDANVAELKIVETVWVREATSDSRLGVETVRSDPEFKAAVAWDEGNNHEFENCNHRIVDIAALKEHVEAAASIDFTAYNTYSKQLLVIPKVANADISVMVKENIDISNLAIDESIVVDWEITANKLTTYGWEKDSTSVDFANTSSLGLGYDIGNGNVSTAVQADGLLLQTAKSGENTYDGSVSWNDWNYAFFDKDAGYKRYGGVHVGYGGATISNYVIDANADPVVKTTSAGNILLPGNSANGLTYGLRAAFSPYSGYTSSVRFSHNNDTNDKDNPAWNQIGGDYAVVTGVARNLVKASDTLDIKLNYTDSGMSFYLDNIVVKKVKSNAEQITIKLDGKDFTALAGQEIPVAALVDNIDGFLLAIGKDSSNTETVYALNSKITPTDGMSITPYTVDLSVSKAELRTDMPTGIRWVTQIDKDTVTKLEDLKTRGLITKVEIGTIITPASYAEKAGGVTEAKLKTLPSNYPYVVANATFGTWYASDETTYSFAGSVVEILEAHNSMDYVGRGFIKLTIPAEAEGEEPTETLIYAPADDTVSVANAAELATPVVNNSDNGLSEAVVAELKKYLQ